MIKAPAILERLSSLKDGGLSLGFHTNELHTSDMTKWLEKNGKFGWLIFAENEIDDVDIPKDKAPREGKSKSQILRAMIFILWKEEGQQGDFEVYYRRKMDNLIENIRFNIDHAKDNKGE